MKFIFLFLILAQSPFILASGPKYTKKIYEEKYKENRSKATHNTSRPIKTIISQKSIQNVLKTVEILKQRSETTYRQKKDQITQKQSI